MVSFGGLMRGFGAGLSQVGRLQYEEQQQAARDQRLMDREIALARLRQQMNLDADAVDRERDIATNATRDDQLVARRKAELGVEEPSRIAEDKRTAARQEASERRRERREDQEPIDTFTDEEGYRVYRYRDGTEVRSRARARDTDSGSDDDERREVDTFTGEDGYRYTTWSDGTQTRSDARARETGGGDDEDDSFLPRRSSTVADVAGRAAEAGGRAAQDAARRAGTGRDSRRNGTLRARGGEGEAPVAGARFNERDGEWYVQRGGRWYRVDQ